MFISIIIRRRERGRRGRGKWKEDEGMNGKKEGGWMNGGMWRSRGRKGKERGSPHEKKTSFEVLEGARQV